MPGVITVGMGKGGVGKSLLAFHLIQAAAEAGRVLALDLDRQGSLLSLLGVDRSQDLAGVLAGFVPFVPQMLKPAAGKKNVCVLAGDQSLVQAQAMLLVGGKGPDYLRRLLPTFGQFDAVVIDTATEGYLSEMALAAANLIVAPVAMQTADADMLPQFLDRAGAINPQAKVLVIPNRYDRRTRISAAVWERVVDLCASRGAAWTQYLPETVGLDYSRLGGRPVWEARQGERIAADLRGAVDYALELAGIVEPAKKERGQGVYNYC